MKLLCFVVVALVAACNIALAAVVDVESLNGDMWTLSNSNRSGNPVAEWWQHGVHGNSLPAYVPGDVFGDLMRNDIIGDPFYRFNDERYRWIPYTNWSWSRPLNIKVRTGVELVFEGVQAIATARIHCNATSVSLPRMTDQFRRYVFDVTDTFTYILNKCRESRVTLTLDFESSVDYATRQWAAYNTTSPKPNAPAYLTGLPHRNFIRTEQSSFGWDWSPAFAPQGIYRDIFLRYFYHSAAATIDYVVPHVFPLPYNQTVPKPLSDAHNAFWIDTRVYVNMPNAEVSLYGSVTVSSKSLNGVSNHSRTIVFNKSDPSVYIADEGLFELRVSLYVENVTLWWPRGFGKPTLHRLDVKLTVMRDSGVVESTSTHVETGVRSMELVTWGDPLSYDPGKRDDVYDRPVMFFRVNGYPVFAKGANLVPFDAFQFRVNKSVMENILDSAVEANMNMIRVWGGGLFPLQSFYDMADRKGILLWQEMIFACAAYPIDKPFLDNVRGEIAHQLKRLGRHPSIAVWSGNNENGIYDKGPGSPYEILDYDNVLYEIIRQDTSRPVWPTSPSNGFIYGTTPSGLPSGTMDHPLPFFVGKGNKSGDTHFYDYFTCPNETVYPRSNFASEYGFQSLPWFQNIETVSEQQDWSLFSPWMNHRQHHPQGNMEIEQLIKQNFPASNIDFNSTALATFKKVIYLTQLQQTLCIANEAEFYRRGRNAIYRTMGSLYWQLNQNWPAPSWTSIEYGGDWKVLHYRMKEVYDTFHVSSFYNHTTGTIEAHVASDALETTKLHLTVYLLPYSASVNASFEDLKVYGATHDVPGLGGLFFWNHSRSELMATPAAQKACPGGQRSACFLYFEMERPADDGRASIFAGVKQSGVVVEKGYQAGGSRRVGAPSTLWLTAVKEAALAPAGVQVKVSNIDTSACTFDIELTSNTTALYSMIRVRDPTIMQGRFTLNAAVVLSPALLAGAPKHKLKFHCVVPPSGAPPPALPSNATLIEENLYVDTLNDMW